MTDLSQQLEDKKKGCGEHFIFVNKYCGDKRPLGEDTDEPTWLCPHCQAKIAILEQAIAEMQKQRQEILDIFNKVSELQRRANFFYLDEKDLTNKKYERGQYDAYHNVLRLFEKLNQPKTEQ